MRRNASVQSLIRFDQTGNGGPDSLERSSQAHALPELNRINQQRRLEGTRRIFRCVWLALPVFFCLRCS
jgi:hypothetical protein